MRFTHDVFLCYAARDARAVDEVAARLSERGLRVWGHSPGDSSRRSVEEGLESSAALVLCMSEQAFGFGWGRLESMTFRHRDPVDYDRRFIPLRLDHATPPNSLARHLAIDWREGDDEAVDRLANACGRRPSPIGRRGPSRPVPGRAVSLGHADAMSAVACHPDGTRVVTASDDGTLRVWNPSSGTCESVLEAEASAVTSVAVDAVGSVAVAAYRDRTIRVWDLATGACESTLRGHADAVWAVAIDAAATRAVSGSADQTVRAWNLLTNTCERTLAGHRGRVWGVAIDAPGKRALSASEDRSVRVWDLATGACEHVLTGHRGLVRGVAIDAAGDRAVSASADRTVRVWNLASGTCERVLEGHLMPVTSVAIDAAGDRAASSSTDSTVRVWNLATGNCERVLNHDGWVLGVAIDASGVRAASVSDDHTLRVWDLAGSAGKHALDGQTGRVRGVAIDATGFRAASASRDHDVRLWNLRTGVCEHVLRGHTGSVAGVAIDAQCSRAASASDDHTVRVWNLSTGAGEQVLRGHTRAVTDVAITVDGGHVASASEDESVRVWDLASGRCQQVLGPLGSAVLCISMDAAGSTAVSGSRDGTVRVWKLRGGRYQRVLPGHNGPVLGIAVNASGTRAVSASDDRTVRVWDLRTGTCVRILEGHTAPVLRVAVDAADARAASAGSDGVVRVWDLSSGACERVVEVHAAPIAGLAFTATGSIVSAAHNGVLRIWDRQPMPSGDPAVADEEDEVIYTNAKVVLVGESQAGKTGLAMRLAHDRWELTGSTVGAWATQLKLGIRDGGYGRTDREIWLWDFGGQADQRLVHQLYMGDAALSILVFDGQREDLVARLWDWQRALQAARTTAPSILVAGRTDVSAVRLSRREIDTVRNQAGFDAYLETSAKNNVGCPELRDLIVASIDWSQLPRHTSPTTFRRLRDAILALKDAGRVLTSIKELNDLLPARIGPFKRAELETVVQLLAGPGAVMQLEFGSYVLLRPELINAYAQAVINSLRDDPHERGCIADERVRSGDLSYDADFERLSADEEQVVLHAMHEQLVKRALCLRTEDSDDEDETMLVFPSFYRRERPDAPSQPPEFMTYHFDGFLDAIYATLVVRLHHAKPFKRAGLWRNAADLKTTTNKTIGLRLSAHPSGRGVLELHCEPTTLPIEQVIFAQFVDEHLRAHARDVERLRTYTCPVCRVPDANRDIARRRLLQGKEDIGCGNCDHRIPLWDDIEQQLDKQSTRQRVADIRDQTQGKLNSESRERLLVGDVLAMAASANQIARELTVSDHGIDMEIEFKDHDGRATGRKLYLQLKSGDSHLRTSGRRRVFRIRKERHADYWAQQQFPVMLVIRDSYGGIEWMEIREPLRRQRETGPWPARELDFAGERLDVMSIRRWRDRELEQGGD